MQKRNKINLVQSKINSHYDHWSVLWFENENKLQLDRNSGNFKIQNKKLNPTLGALGKNEKMTMKWWIKFILK